MSVCVILRTGPHNSFSVLATFQRSVYPQNEKQHFECEKSPRLQAGAHSPVRCWSLWVVAVPCIASYTLLHTSMMLSILVEVFSRCRHAERGFCIVAHGSFHRRCASLCAPCFETELPSATVWLVFIRFGFALVVASASKGAKRTISGVTVA